MAKLIKGPEREQLALFELRIEDMISEENEVRVIDAFVDSLPLEELGFKRVVANEEGTNHYDDRDLLKLYIYGYKHKARSSRLLEELCKVNVEVIWMLRGVKPNFRTICDFRKDHVEDIKKVFKELVKFCGNIGLVSNKQSQDGVKIRAVNSKENNYTLNKIDDRIKRIDIQVEKYMKALNKADKADELEISQKEAIERNKEEIRKLMEQKASARAELETIKQEIENKKESQKSLVDPESRLMKNNGSFEVCYNNQVIVDVESHIVTNYHADNNPADMGTMKDIMEELKEMLGVDEVMKDITDQGYKDVKDMGKCLENGIIPEVTLGKEEKEYRVEFEYEENEITEEMRKSEKKEDIAKCLKSGVIPEVYEEVLREIKKEERRVYKTIEEVETEGNKMDVYDKRNFAIENKCFVRDEKTDKVYCPQGESLRKKSKHKDGAKYCNKMACKNCKNPCTRAKFKELVMGAKQVVSSTDRKIRETYNPKSKKKVEKVMLISAKITPKKEDLDKRMATSEHVHGSMKRTDDMSYFLLKGKEKVNGELGLYYIGSNIRRMVKIMGVKALLEKIKEKQEEKEMVYA